MYTCVALVFMFGNIAHFLGKFLWSLQSFPISILQAAISSSSLVTLPLMIFACQLVLLTDKAFLLEPFANIFLLSNFNAQHAMLNTLSLITLRSKLEIHYHSIPHASSKSTQVVDLPVHFSSNPDGYDSLLVLFLASTSNSLICNSTLLATPIMQCYLYISLFCSPINHQIYFCYQRDEFDSFCIILHDVPWN